MLLNFSAFDYPDLYHTVGQLFLEKKKYKKAKEFLLPIAPVIAPEIVDHDEVLCDLSHCHAVLGEEKLAQKVLETAVRDNPAHHRAVLLLVRIYKALKMFNEVQELCDAYFEAQDEPDILVMMEKISLDVENENLDTYIEDASVYVSEEYLETFRKKVFRKNNRLEALIKKGEPYSDEVKDYLARRVLEEDGDDLFRLAQMPRITPMTNEEKRRKEKLLEEYADYLLSICQTLLKQQQFVYVQKTLDILSRLADRHFMSEPYRKFRLKWTATLCTLGLRDYPATFISLRSIMFQFPHIAALWRLYSYLIAHNEELGGYRTLSFANTLVEDLDKQKGFLHALILYGNTLLASRMYRRALRIYFYLSGLQPENPFISLYLGITCIGYLNDKLVSNRHQMVLLAFTFLFKYHRLRTDKSEANFNLARAFHQLKLHHHAIPFYEKVLQEDPGTYGGRNYQPLAAFNLSRLYLATGADTLAQELLDRYLVF